jgi:hypothetical protein
LPEGLPEGRWWHEAPHRANDTAGAAPAAVGRAVAAAAAAARPHAIGPEADGSDSVESRGRATLLADLLSDQPGR